MKRAFRAAASVSAALVVVGLSAPSPALALPLAHQNPPNTASEALAQYKKLSKQVEKVNEDLLAARNDLDKKKAQLRRANADLAAAKKSLKQAAADEEAFRGKVDKLTSASFQGARFNKLSALLTGSSADDFLERASALGVLASDNEEALAKLSRATNLASNAQAKSTSAQKSATEATNTAKALVSKITKTKTKLDAQIEQIHNAYNDLSQADQQALAGPQDNSVFIGGPGAGGHAAEVAMAQRGKPYIYGADGPDSFDCSGLTMFAYASAGISLPHSARAQFGYGKSVDVNDLKQGDLLFYGSSVDTIHHVGMYIGNGMMVHASTEGVPVGTASAPYGGGNDFIGARRLAP